jgi:predicted alpha/beta hydrolase family esterase
MTKFLILHGTDGTPDSNWFMWLKGVLVGKGHKVWLPQLPDADKPSTEKYTKFLLSNPDFKFDKDTIIIGHSSGAVEILNLLQHLPNDAVIKAAILVSVFKDDLKWDSLTELFTEPLDFKAIKSHCPKFIFVHSDNDPYSPIEHSKYLARGTGGRLTVLEGQGHFNTEIGPQYKQFPQLLEIIETIQKTRSPGGLKGKVSTSDDFEKPLMQLWGRTQK